MNLKYHLWAAWGGAVFVILFGVGWSLLGHFAPPPISPALGPDEIAAFYRGNLTMIRLGLNIVMLACAPMVPFYALVSIQLSRIEGRWPLLSMSQFILGFANILFFYVPVILWQVAAFRPDRDPAIIQVLNDFGWMIIMWPFSLAAMQNIVTGLVIIADKRPKPIFPRWFAYFNFWVAIALLAGAPIPFFKSGPFAWDGLFGFWLPTIFYLLWIALTSVFLVGAVKRQIASGDVG